MAINAEKLNIILSARDKEFTKAMDRSQKRVAHFAQKSQKNLSKTSKSFSALGDAAKRLAPVLAAAFSVQAFKGALDSAVQIDNLSRLAGVGVERFQVLAAATSEFGIEQEKLADILKDVNDKFGDFTQTGAGPLADFFENIAPKVGLTASAFADLSSEDKLGAYVAALEKANVSQSEMTFYMEAIASDSTALVGAFKNNSAAIKEMEQRASELGIVLDREVIANAREAKTELALVSKVISANLSQALIDLAPLAVNAAQAIASIAQAIGDLGYNAPPPLLNRDEIKALAAEYKGLQKELTAVTQAEAMYDANTKKFGENSTQSKAAAERLEIAKEELKLASEIIQKKKAAEDSAVGTIRAMHKETELLKEQVLLRGVSAKDAELRRIAVQRAAYEDSILSDMEVAQDKKRIEFTDRQIEGVTILGKRYTEAAIAASLILNPVKAAGAATKEIAREAQSAREAYVQMLNEMVNASPALQQLGFDADNLESTMNMVENSMESAFMSMVDGTSSAKDAFKSMAAEIIKELYRVLVVQQLVGAISGFITGGSGVTSSPRPMSSPFRASGGPVSAGQSYVTGEHGRELFVPKTDGRILSGAQTSNAFRGSGESVTVIQNNTFQSGVTRSEVSALLPKMVEASKAAVIDAKRQGGSYGKAFA